MQTRRFLGLTLVLVLGLGGPAYGVTVCFDYVLYMLTGTDPRPVGDHRMQGTSAGDVIAVLNSQGYKRLSRMPAGNELKAKDVIFLGTSHVGYVAAPDSIYHFLQVEGTSRTNVKYDAGALPKHQDLGGKRGGYFEGDSLADFLSRPYIPATSYEVWRQSTLVGLVGVWSWSASVYSGNFSITSQQPDGTFTGQFSATTPQDVGTIQGSVQGDTIQFTRSGIWQGKPFIQNWTANLENDQQIMRGNVDQNVPSKWASSFSAQRR